MWESTLAHHVILLQALQGLLQAFCSCHAIKITQISNSFYEICDNGILHAELVFTDAR